jgi:hypothetical protein
MPQNQERADWPVLPEVLAAPVSELSVVLAGELLGDISEVELADKLRLTAWAKELLLGVLSVRLVARKLAWPVELLEESELVVERGVALALASEAAELLSGRRLARPVAWPLELELVSGLIVFSL